MYWKLFLKALPYILGALLLWFISAKVYHHIYNKGAASIQMKWDQDKAEKAQAIAKLQTAYDDLSYTSRLEQSRISNELSKAQNDYAIALGNLRLDYANRVRSSEERAKLYQRQAESGPDQCRSLASYAGRLDSSLEEGRSLVRELRETLGLRDKQLTAVGNQLLTDRKLFTDDTSEVTK